MIIQRYPILPLWLMPPEEFNVWRQKNDLPILLQLLNAKLPSFQEWTKLFSIEEDTFIAAPHTSEWLLGNTSKEFVCYENDGAIYYAITNSFEKQFNFISQHHTIKLLQRKSFKPYLIWGKEKVGKNRFILLDERNNQFSDTIEYRSWSSNTDGTMSRAQLFHSFNVLKLGQVALPDGVHIGNRNLDFVDLDFLEVNGEWHGSYATQIGFSSCRNIVIKGSLHHVTFEHCNTEDFSAINSKLQDFTFRRCQAFRHAFRDSMINGLEYAESALSCPIIENTDLQRLVYSPASWPKEYTAAQENHRRFRTAFQNKGRLHEAREHYYKEKCYERKSLFSPYLQHRQLFGARKYAGRLVDLYSQWRDGLFTPRKSMECLVDLVLFQVKIWLVPKYLLRTIMFKLKYLISLFEYFLWGYGERPVRIFVNSVVAVLIYSALFFWYGPAETSKNIVNSLYLSMITFTTLGYGDILPKTAYQKIMCGTEALTGAFLIGLVIAGFANRSKY